MSRLSDAILNGAYSTGNATPMTDLKYGGMNGYAPNLTEYISNQAYVSRPLTCIVLEFPMMFKYMPNPEKWQASVKALFEVHAKSIDGFNAGLTVDTDEHAIGGSNEMQQEIVNVTRARTEPQFNFTEKYGRPIQNLLEYWIRYGMMDPDTKTALIGTLGNVNVTDLLADWYSMTCLFYEADPLNRKIQKAWLTTNMYPLSTGDITAKRDLTASQEMLDLSITMAGISQYSSNVRDFAQRILDSINIAGADPYRRATIVNDISSDVSAINTTGYTNTVNTGASNFGA